jgi:hypothetical protein
MKKDKFPDFKKEFKEAGKLFRNLPRHAGKMYLDFIEKNFDKEQFGDTGKDWPEREKENRRGGRAARGNRALLVLNSDLKNSFEYNVSGRDVIIMTPVILLDKALKWNENSDSNINLESLHTNKVRNERIAVS